MKNIINILTFLLFLYYSHSVTSEVMNFSNDNLIADGNGNIIDLASGTIFKELEDGTVLNTKSGILYKKLPDGSVLKLQTELNIPIIVR